MDTDRLMKLVPHYVAMLLIVFLLLAVVQAVVGDLGFWAELVVIAVVVFGYRPAVVRLGFGPSEWERR